MEKNTYTVNSLLKLSESGHSEILDLSTKQKSDEMELDDLEAGEDGKMNKLNKSKNNFTDFFFNLFSKEMPNCPNSFLANFPLPHMLSQISPKKFNHLTNPMSTYPFPNLLPPKSSYLKHIPIPQNNDLLGSLYLQNLLHNRLASYTNNNNNITNPNLNLSSSFNHLDKDPTRLIDQSKHHHITTPPNNDAIFSSKGFALSQNLEIHSNNHHFNLQSLLKSSQVNRKRKRTKVTDTRLPRRNFISNNCNSNNPNMNIHSPPLFHTSFHHQNQSHSFSESSHNLHDHLSSGNMSQFRTNSSNLGLDESDNHSHNLSSFLTHPASANTPNSTHSEDISGDPKKYTLTPIHLRKAKLMFLYTRYPNSQMLKSFFPDITFYKQNTAQLVKWFSNFREFYYSEMEKAVQRAISNGVKLAKELEVNVESELFKNLMTHFNKKKQIIVPCEFLTTVQITIQEFFEAISTGKNLHQSWKKPIYKNIAKLDQPLPDFFKDMNWMLELAKDENENISS